MAFVFKERSNSKTRCPSLPLRAWTSFERECSIYYETLSLSLVNCLKKECFQGQTCFTIIPLLLGSFQYCAACPWLSCVLDAFWPTKVSWGHHKMEKTWLYIGILFDCHLPLNERWLLLDFVRSNDGLTEQMTIRWNEKHNFRPEWKFHIGNEQVDMKHYPDSDKKVQQIWYFCTGVLHEFNTLKASISRCANDDDKTPIVQPAWKHERTSQAKTIYCIIHNDKATAKP